MRSHAGWLRAMRILHVISTEAERRGWSAASPTVSKNRVGGRTWTAKDGHLALTADGQHFRVRLREGCVHARGTWDEEVGRFRYVSGGMLHGRPVPSGSYDAEGSGRLEVELTGSSYWLFAGRQSRWGDRRSWSLDDRIPHLFREIEERLVIIACDAEQKRLTAEAKARAAELAAEKRKRTWQVHMDEARVRFAKARHAAELRPQAAAWREVDHLRRYCDAAEATHGRNPETAEWLSWARSHIADLDPLSKAPIGPEPVEPTADALQEHLPSGWSAHGPDGTGTERARGAVRP